MPTLRVPPAVAGLKGNAVTVQRWLKKPGDSFVKGDLLVELDSEDALLHLEATEAGTIARLLTEVGKTVALGTALAEFSAGASSPAITAHVSAPVASVQKAPMSNPTPAGKVIPILMPQAGNTMEEGRILIWKVKVGDRVSAGQIICEIETDKASIEFEAPEAGRIARIVAPENSVVPVKQPIAVIAENDADVDAALGAGGSPASGGEAVGIPTSQGAPISAPPAGSVIPLLMPQAGNSMEEGTVTKWRVNPGDRITVGQIIYEIDTDKASVEVEATEAGRLARIVAPVGSVIPVKQAVGYLAENDADVDAFIGAGGAAAAPVAKAAPAAAPQPKAAETAAATVASIAPTSSNGGRVKASPAARRIASERGLDLHTVGAGSGPGGRILSTDLDRAGKAAAKAPAAPAASSAPAKIIESLPVPAVPGPIVRKPMSKMRKAIATNLQASKQTVPHFYVKLTINADPLFAFYRAQKPATNCTLNDVVLLAVGKTVWDFPAFRSRIDGNEFVEMPSSNIGVAVSVDDGLVVPVIMGLERHTLATLPAESKRIVEAGRKGKLENVGKGVFTISNMGMLGVEDFSAIINPPESGILAVSAVREAVIVKDGAMKAGRVMSMTLSVDHRVVDGALAAQWIAKLKDRLENPESMLS